MGLFAELRRRNVIRVAVAYLIGAWLLLQVTEVLRGLMDLPSGLGRAVVVLLAIGFPVVLAFAWVFEITPEGIKREREIDRSQSAATQTGKRLNILIIAMLALAAAYFFWESRLKAPAESPPPVVTDATSDTGSAVDDGTTSIAVLPFVNMSPDPDNEYFADGLSEEILNRLAQVQELRVIARTSAFAFKGQNRDLREIGALLGTGNILEGSVRRQGEQVRVTAQLIDASDGAHLWSQTWDRQLDDVFAIQDEIAQKVVDALDIVLDEATRQAMLAAGVRDVGAFVAYQKGYQAFVDAHGDADMLRKLEAAIPLFDEAIAAAPDFADAYAQKTDYYAHLVMDSDLGLAEREAALATLLDLYATALEKARDPLHRHVIELDRTFFTDDWSRLPVLLREIFASGSCTDGNWMELALPFAATEEQLAFYQRQVRCNPMLQLTHVFLSGLYLRQGDLAKAEETLERARSIAGDHRWLQMPRRQVRLLKGEGESVVAELRQEVEGLPADDPRSGRARHALAYCLAALGQIEEARNLLTEQAETTALTGIDPMVLSAVLGDRAAANQAAATLDAMPGGPAELVRRTNGCACGAPFDLESTPRLAARIREAGFPWPPPTIIQFPAKDW